MSDHAITQHLRTTTFKALYNRNYRLLWTGLVVSNAGAWMQTVAQGWLVLQLSGHAFNVGLIGLVRAIPLVILSLFGGTLADMLERRKVLYITQTLQALSAGLLAFLTITGLVQVWHVYACAFFSATALAFDQPSRQSLIPTLVTKDELMNAVVLNSIAFQGSALIGPTIAGALVPYIGLGGCFLANALSYAAVIVALARMDIPPGAASKRSKSMWQDVLQGLREVAYDKRLLALVLIAAFTSFFGRGYNAYLPVFAEQVLHVGVRELGFLMSASGLGTVIASLTVASAGNLKHKGKIGILGNLVFAVFLIAYAWSRSLAVSYVLLMFVGGVFMVCQSVINTSLQLIARNEVRGRVTSVFTLTGLALMPLGQAPLGALMEHVGPSISVTVFAGVVFLATAVIALVLPQMWRMN